MKEVVGSAGSRARPPWSILGSPMTRVWREKGKGRPVVLWLAWRKKENGRSRGERRSPGCRGNTGKKRKSA